MKKLLAFLLLCVSAGANAQFTPGQLLTAGELNSQFTLYSKLSGATFTGPVTVPTLNTSNAAITGGTITGLSAPIPVASGGTGANTASGAIAALGAAPVIAANTTLNVPSSYATIQAACDSLANAVIVKPAMVTIQVANGTYNDWHDIECKSPYGDQIQIIGNQASPSSVVINVDDRNSQKLFDFFRGNRIFLIDGFTINGTYGWQSHGVWAANTYGAAFYALDSGSGAIVGSNVRINKMYYGLLADLGARFDVASGGGLTVNECGDVGILSRWGSHIQAESTTVTNCSDVVNTLGFGYMGEAGGFIDASYSNTSGNAVGGFVVQNGGSAWYHNVTASNSGYNLYSNEGSAAEYQNSTSTGGTYGAFANNHSYMYLAGATISGASAAGVNADMLSHISLGSGATANSSVTGFSQYDNSFISGAQNGTGNTTLFFNGNFGAFTGGSFTSSNPIVTYNDTSGSGFPGSTYQNNGVTKWVLHNVSSSNQFGLDRYVSGVFSDSPITVSNSTGVVSFADGWASAGNTSMTSSNPIMTINDTSGTGFPGFTFQHNGSNRWVLHNVSSSDQFGVDRYVSGSYVDTPLYIPNANGYVYVLDGLSLPVKTVATLPTCNSGLKGLTMAVSDATSPTYNGTLTGSGTVSVPVYCNGSSWTSH